MQAIAERQSPNEIKVIEDVRQMLSPFRFQICTTPEQATEAYAVRRAVYEDGCDYAVETPDDIDSRSWLLLAREADTGRAVGTMRATPRSHGPLELERYFRLPLPLTRGAVELSRFAILPEFRQTSNSPAVSIGMFNLVKRFLDSIDTQYMLLASKAKRAHTYQWLRFTGTGIEARYPELGQEKHELMFMNLPKAHIALEGHPLEIVLNGYPFESVEVPDGVPALGMGAEMPKIAAWA